MTDDNTAPAPGAHSLAGESPGLLSLGLSK